MRGCNRDLYVPKCCKCKTVCLKTKFHRNIVNRDGLKPICKSCRNEFCVENRERSKQYYLENAIE